MENEKFQSMTEAQLYDSVFWTVANTLSEYIAPLVNEMFGEHFTSKAKVDFLANKQTTTLPDGSIARRELDALVRLSERRIKHDYHFECEILGRSSVALRIAQYNAGYAFKSAKNTTGGAIIEIPNSAVIFLRAESTKFDKLTITIRYPGGEAQYDVPVLRIRDYSLDEIFEKELLLLVPFYVFKFNERVFRGMDNDPVKLADLRALIDDIHSRLEKFVIGGKLEPQEKSNLMRYLDVVLRKRAKNYTQMQKGVDEIMGGYIIETDVDIACERGKTIGQAIGEVTGEDNLATAIEMLRDGKSRQDILDLGIKKRTIDRAAKLI